MIDILSVRDSDVRHDGYLYYINGKIGKITRCQNRIFKAKVLDFSGNVYSVMLDVDNPKKSECSCPKSSCKHKFCSHMAALYFAIFPAEAKRYYLIEGAPYDEKAFINERRKEKVKRWALKADRADLIEFIYALIDVTHDKTFEKFCNDNERLFE